MEWLAKLRMRLRALRHGEEVHGEIAEEWQFPIDLRTEERSAFWRLIPSFIFSSTAISMKPCSSSFSSESARSLWNSDRSPLIMVGRIGMATMPPTAFSDTNPDP
jgi:hypothetical protein